MDGTFLMLHSSCLITKALLRRNTGMKQTRLAISQLFTGWTHLWVALFPSLKDLSVHGCQETPHVPELDLTHTRKLSNWVWSQFN
ncbi:BnaA05g36260D [Brassica napus]|uniref:(rape) hypothetical protein n=1 Tax=Brassica napus TaxID=3708 RepID=A0A078JI53_BRANA|nr:unnamed protein product [Brassica napus]CDY66180.1 BnaA05g36260D [Brassica napus]